MKRKRNTPEEQGSLFAGLPDPGDRPRRKKPGTEAASDTWKMPEVSGQTVAQIRLRWNRRLTPAQVSKVERELSRLPPILTRLGFGTVQVERVSVRRRKS